MTNSRKIKARVPVATVAGVDDANNVSVEVYFDAGGMNYSDYSTTAKGYYASLHATKVGTSGTGFDTESFMMFGGRAIKVFLAPADRFNAKTLAKLAAPFLAKATELATTFATNADNTASFAALRAVGGLPAAAAA